MATNISQDKFIPENFPPLKNDLLLRAARGEKTERVPVWVMRQAGRYLPEYHEVSGDHDFFYKCRTPSLACEITLQPIRRFELDAAIIFSDILVVPQALGMSVHMEPQKGPIFDDPLQGPEDLERLNQKPDVNKELDYVFKAITLTRHSLEGKVPLYGFSGAPWTLMMYMLGGGSAKVINPAKTWLYVHPEASHKLLQLLTDVIIQYLVGQVRAGAQILQVFESNAGDMGKDLFTEFALPYLRQIAHGVKEKLKQNALPSVPLAVFPRLGHYALADLSKCGYDIISLDWSVDPIEARKVVGPEITLQGNLDPDALTAPKEAIPAHVQKMVKDFGTHRYIANLGHGVKKETDPDHLKVFVDAVHQCSEEINAKS